MAFCEPGDETSGSIKSSKLNHPSNYSLFQGILSIYMRSQILSNLHKILWSNLEEIGEACNTHGMNVKYISEFQSKPLKKEPLARYRRILEGIIKTGLWEILCKDQWGALVNKFGFNNAQNAWLPKQTLASHDKLWAHYSVWWVRDKGISVESERE